MFILHWLKTTAYLKFSSLTTRTRLPIACGGRFLLNFAFTVPALPCTRVIFPQIARTRLGAFPCTLVFLCAL